MRVIYDKLPMNVSNKMMHAFKVGKMMSLWCRLQGRCYVFASL